MRPGTLVFLLLPVLAHAQSSVFERIQRLGGSRGESIAGIATDAQGNLYVAGSTASVDFPVLSAVQPHPGASGLFRFDGAGQWQNLFSVGLTSVQSFARDARHPNIVFAVGPQGIFRSNDAGANWTALGTLDNAAGVAADPFDSGVLYAITSPAGVFKSVDGGAAWTAANNGIVQLPIPYAFVGGIWSDPWNAGVVFASAAPGLARSSDGAANWVMSPAFSLNTPLYDLAFDLSDPGRIYAATGNGMQLSTDDGVTWTQLPAPATGLFEAESIVIDPANPAILYVCNRTGGIFRSVDRGNTWTNRYGSGVAHLAVDPASNVIYGAAGPRVIASSDGFSTSTPIGPTVSYVNALLVADSHLFLGALESSDVFVAKFDPQGAPLYATYLGGASLDVATAMAVDAAGSVYVTGATNSVDFPVSDGAYAVKGGNNFVFKLNPDGSLSYSTYFSGGNPNAIAVDGRGQASIAGLTFGGLPTTPGAYQTQFSGSLPPCCPIIGPGPPPPINAFLTRFDAAGARLVFSTYLGSQSAFAQALALAPDGTAFVAGSNSIYHVSADGSVLLGNTILPATIWALATDSAGNVYAGGVTSTTPSQPFPVTDGAFQTTPFPQITFPGTSADTRGHAFVTKFDPQFHILASTLLAGEGTDETLALAIAGNGSVFAAGSTFSKGFPSRGPAQGSFARATGFVTELTSDLSSVVFSTFAGDTRPFHARGLAPTADGGVWFAGATSQPPSFAYYALASVLAPQPDLQAFLVKTLVKPASPRIDSVVNAASRLGVALSPGVVFDVNGEGFDAASVLLLNGASLPILARRAARLTAMLPSDFDRQGAAAVAVRSGGGVSNTVVMPLATAAPGIYSADGSGIGQGYILNADGTRNSPENPARAGDPITIFATGVGPLTFDQGYAVTASPVIVSVDGIFCNGIAAIFGPAEGLAGSVYQISVFAPRPDSFVLPPLVPVTLDVNGARSQASIALSVVQ